MATSRTPTSSSHPALKLSSLQSATSASSPATPNNLQQLQQDQLQLQKQDTTPQPIPLPPPQTFDILPPLHDLLLRLASNPSSHHHHHHNHSHPSSSSAPPGANTAVVTRSTAIDTNAVAFLDPKLLLSEASAVKIRIQKAKAALEGLPDMQRGVEEQEREIEGLEERIGRLRGVIGEFGRRGADVRVGQGTDGKGVS